MGSILRDMVRRLTQACSGRQKLFIAKNLATHRRCCHDIKYAKVTSAVKERSALLAQSCQLNITGSYHFCMGISLRFGCI